MKNYLLNLLLFCCLSASAITRHLDLKTAQNKNFIRCQFLSLGRYQGDCMQLIAQNLLNDSLYLLIPAGTRLDSKNDLEQDILLTQQMIVKTGPREKFKTTLTGYCCQASHHAPKNNSAYSLLNTSDSALTKIASLLNQRHFDSHIEQNAIWAISNHHPLANIPDSSEALVTLRYTIAGLTGQTIPWYNIYTRTLLSRNGAMQQIPLTLCGTIFYSNNIEQYVTCTVLNEKGRPVGKIQCQWLKAGQNLAYPISLTLAGLEKGKYSVSLNAGAEVLGNNEFEL